MKTLFDKLWGSHIVVPETDEAPAVIYIDLHLVHEVTSPQAFSILAEGDRQVRRPDRTFATMDHSTPTLPANGSGEPPFATPEAREQVEQLRRNCAAHDIPLLDMNDGENGVVHVVGPEQGLTQPGMTIVCGDSHTSTHGAFGAFAFGIGTTEVAHVLATQCLLQRKPKTMRVWVDGNRGAGVSAKDIILAVIAEIGVDGGTGKVIEYAGAAVEALSMEERMTVCNMSIEAGARAGLIAPDGTTFRWLREHGDFSDAEWNAKLKTWQEFRTDPGATFDSEIRIDATKIEPMVTFGTAPDTGIGVHGVVPSAETNAEKKALDYMDMKAGAPIAGTPVNNVFIGSCTNGRLSDLKAAAKILKGRKVKDGVRMIVVPGSPKVKADAEAAGLHQVFTEAGAEWRLPGCSMCIAMNGDFTKPGELTVSTSNRNFEGRQGKGARTVLASPMTAAAAAVAGEIADPRDFIGEQA